MYRPRVVLSPELTGSSAASLGKVLQSPHSDVAWLEPHRYCWVPPATKDTSSDASPQGDDATNVAVASHGIPTWTGAIYGTVPEAEIIGAAAYLLHTPPSACTVHVVGASVIGAHLRRAQEALYRGIKGPTSHLVNQHALSWIVEGLRRLPRRVGGPHHWVVRQSSHLAAVPLEAPDSAAARAMAPPVHLVLPKEHAILLVPGDNGELEPRVPSMQALQRALAARTRAHTPLAGACEAMPLGAVHHGPTHTNMLRARDGRLSTMHVMRRWRQKLTRMSIPAHPCIFCGGPEEDIGHMRLLCARDEEVAGLLCRRVEEFTAELPLTDRAVEFVAWREHGCRWTESLMAGVVPGDLKRLFAAVRAASSRGRAKARLFVEDMVQIGEDVYASRTNRLTKIMQLFHTLSCGSLVRIVTAHGPTPSIRLHRGLRQGSAESAVLYLLLLEPLLRSLARKARGDARHAVPPLVQAYCDDLLLIAHSLPQFVEYSAAIARYLTDMGMSLNVGKCAYANTARMRWYTPLPKLLRSRKAGIPPQTPAPPRRHHATT